MNAEELLVHDGCQGETVKGLHAGVIHAFRVPENITKSNLFKSESGQLSQRVFVDFEPLILTKRPIFFGII